MANIIGGKAAKIALAAVGAAALSTVGVGVVQFCKWAKDPYSTELWFGFLKKGILITKTDEPGHFKVQKGYRWHNDTAEDGEEFFDEPEMEITLPTEAFDPQQDEPEAVWIMDDDEAEPGYLWAAVKCGHLTFRTIHSPTEKGRVAMSEAGKRHSGNLRHSKHTKEKAPP